MKNLAVGSAFRNAAGNVQAYFERIKALQVLLDKTGIGLRVIAGEGDSTDNTKALLRAVGHSSGIPVDIADCSHGGPEYGSTEQPERLAALSTVLNRILDVVNDGDDLFLYIEQDLLWEPETVKRLIKRWVSNTHFDILAPMVMAGECFYDVWGFRHLDGSRFGPFYPFSNLLDHRSGEILEVGSVGSCLLMPGRTARDTRVYDGNALVGWCAMARATGHKIGVVPDLRVRQA